MDDKLDMATLLTEIYQKSLQNAIESYEKKLETINNNYKLLPELEKAGVNIKNHIGKHSNLSSLAFHLGEQPPTGTPERERFNKLIRNIRNAVGKPLKLDDYKSPTGKGNKVTCYLRVNNQSGLQFIYETELPPNSKCKVVEQESKNLVVVCEGK